MRSPRRALPALLLVVALAACGSSAGESSTGEKDGDGTTTTAVAETTEAPDETASTVTTEAAPEPTEPNKPTKPSSSTDDPLCGPLKKISDYDKESTAVIEDGSGDWGEIQDYFVDNTQGVLDAYDEAIALDTSLADDFQTIRDLTESTSDLAQESTDLEDFANKLMSLPDIMEAGMAAMRVNSFSEETCGFSTGNN